jgi:hypothetical protein
MKREIRVEPWQLLRSSPSIRSSRYHLDTHRLSGWIKLLFNLSGLFPSQSLESIGLSFNNSFKQSSPTSALHGIAWDNVKKGWSFVTNSGQVPRTRAGIV